jgi:hypothetical protein
MPDLEQVRECSQHLDLAAILGKTTQPRLLKAELLLWPLADFV